MERKRIQDDDEVVSTACESLAEPQKGYAVSVWQRRDTRKFKPPSELGVVHGTAVKSLRDGYWSVRIGSRIVVAKTLTLGVLRGEQVYVRYNESAGHWCIIA